LDALTGSAHPPFSARSYELHPDAVPDQFRPISFFDCAAYAVEQVRAEAHLECSE